jgi:hypothetical protein
VKFQIREAISKIEIASRENTEFSLKQMPTQISCFQHEGRSMSFI